MTIVVDLIILAIIVIMAVSAIGYLYLNYVSVSTATTNSNKNYESLLNKTINGNELATYINQIIDKNTKNSVEKDSNGYYIDNNKDSIILEIKFFRKKVYSTSSLLVFSIMHNGGNNTHQKLLPSAFPISTTSDS